MFEMAISGNEKSAVQSGAYPNEEPVTEYVEMPEGSSSAAPVIKPDPNSAKKVRTPRGATTSNSLFFFFSVTQLKRLVELSGAVKPRN